MMIWTFEFFFAEGETGVIYIRAVERSGSAVPSISRGAEVASLLEVARFCRIRCY